MCLSPMKHWKYVRACNGSPRVILSVGQPGNRASPARTNVDKLTSMDLPYVPPAQGKERRPPTSLAKSRAITCVRRAYFRAPRWGFFSFDCRIFRDLRLGLLMMKVPLP